MAAVIYSWWITALSVLTRCNGDRWSANQYKTPECTDLFVSAFKYVRCVQGLTIGFAD